MVLPTTRDVSLNGEMYAWHEALFAQMAGRYQIPTRRNLQSGATTKAAEYIRGRWALERCAAASTTASRTSTSSSCRRAATRRAPWTRRCSARRPTCRATPNSRTPAQFNVYGIPAISVPCGFTAAGLPIGLMIAGPRFSRGPRPRPGPRLRAGHRVAHQAPADSTRHAGAAAGERLPRSQPRRPSMLRRAVHDDSRSDVSRLVQRRGGPWRGSAGFPDEAVDDKVVKVDDDGHHQNAAGGVEPQRHEYRETGMTKNRTRGDDEREVRRTRRHGMRLWWSVPNCRFSFVILAWNSPASAINRYWTECAAAAHQKAVFITGSEPPHAVGHLEQQRR